MENTLKLIHVLAAIAWFGAGTVRAVLFARARGSGDRLRLITFLEENEFLGRVYYNITGIITLVAGVWLVLISNWEFSQLWISIGFIGVIVGIVWGVVFYPRFQREALAGLADGEVSDVREPLTRFALYANVELLILVIVVWAMVFKPGA